MYMVDREVHGIVEMECGSLHLGHYNNQLVLEVYCSRFAGATKISHSPPSLTFLPFIFLICQKTISISSSDIDIIDIPLVNHHFF